MRSETDRWCDRGSCGGIANQATRRVATAMSLGLFVATATREVNAGAKGLADAVSVVTLGLWSCPHPRGGWPM